MALKKDHIYIILIIVLILINYTNIFRNEFVWDDNTFILENNKITSFEYLPYHFTHESRNSLYRPLRETIYIVTYSIWELNPFGYHLNSIILHSLISVLVFLIIKKITKNKGVAFFSALLFVAHPVNTARVTNMTGTFDMLGLLFYALGFYLFIKYRTSDQKKFLFYSLVAYVLALFSSEEAITFIGVLFLYDICFRAENLNISLKTIKKLLREYLPYIAITIFYIILHILIVKRVGRTLEYFEDNFLTTFLTTIKAVVYYIFLLIYPVNLSIYKTLPKATSFLSINFLISLVVLIVIIFLMVKSFKKSKTLFFGFGWFFITLFLFYNFIPKSTFMADRYLYFPSIGFCLILGHLIYSIRKIKLLKKGVLVSIIVLLIILSSYSVLTIKRNAEWRHEEILLTRAVEVSPLSTDAHWALAGYYRKIKDTDRAIASLKKAVEISSNNYVALEDLGVVYAETEQYDLAIEYFKKAIDVYPESEGGYYKAHNDLGLVYFRIGKTDQAIRELKKAISIHPEFAKAYNDLGTVYAQIGSLELAEKEFKKAIELNPDQETYRKNLGLLYELMKSSPDPK